MHNSEIASITQREFGIAPKSIRRMSNGICNEVYLVDLGEREVVVRLHTEPRYMFGSHNHIPIFRANGITVPEILAEDYSKSLIPFAYQVITKLDGRDINDVISSLSNDELRAIGKEIANVFAQLRTVPNNGKFGVLWGDGDDLRESWSADIAHFTQRVIGWGTRTGVLDDQLRGILMWINAEYKGYFDSVVAMTYFGDICAKNVMIHEGRFAGLVDLDSLAQGDPLEAVGRIKASWFGTGHGRIYADAVMDEMRLTREQRRIVTMYALLNRTYWTMENGVQFNANTSTVVDPQRLEQDKAAVMGLYRELSNR